MSTEKKKRSAEEKLEALVAQVDADDVLAEVSAKSKEEVAKELAAAGIDLEEERERFRVLLEQHGVFEKKKEEAKVVPLAEARPRKRNARVITAWLVAAALATLVGAGLVASIAKNDAPPAPPPSAPLITPPLPQHLDPQPAPSMLVVDEDAGTRERRLSSPPPPQRR